MTHAAPLPSLVFREWVHAHEDDTDAVKVYRPRGTPLPPSRGRDGFEIRPDGTFVYHGIAPTDGTQSAEGRWESDGENRIRADIPGWSEPLVVDIVEVDDETLRVAK